MSFSTVKVNADLKYYNTYRLLNDAKEVVFCECIVEKNVCVCVSPSGSSIGPAEKNGGAHIQAGRCWNESSRGRGGFETSRSSCRRKRPRAHRGLKAPERIWKSQWITTHISPKCNAVGGTACPVASWLVWHKICGYLIIKALFLYSRALMAWKKPPLRSGNVKVKSKGEIWSWNLWPKRSTKRTWRLTSSRRKMRTSGKDSVMGFFFHRDMTINNNFHLISTLYQEHFNNNNHSCN